MKAKRKKMQANRLDKKQTQNKSQIKKSWTLTKWEEK